MEWGKPIDTAIEVINFDATFRKVVRTYTYRSNAKSVLLRGYAANGSLGVAFSSLARLNSAIVRRANCRIHSASSGARSGDLSISSRVPAMTCCTLEDGAVIEINGLPPIPRMRPLARMLPRRHYAGYATVNRHNPQCFGTEPGEGSSRAPLAAGAPGLRLRCGRLAERASHTGPQKRRRHPRQRSGYCRISRCPKSAGRKCDLRSRSELHAGQRKERVMDNSFRRMP